MYDFLIYFLMRLILFPFIIKIFRVQNVLQKRDEF